jgi:hypothetical protein
MVLRSAITASSSVTSGQTANSLPAVCGTEDHLHKEYPEKVNTSSTPTCCNCRLAKGENTHPVNYRGCRQAKDEMQKKSQRTPRTKTGRLSPQELTTPGMSFSAPLRSQRNSNSHRHIRWQVPPLWNPGSLWPYPNKNSRR